MVLVMIHPNLFLSKSFYKKYINYFKLLNIRSIGSFSLMVYLSKLGNIYTLNIHSPILG